jgi:hypothetical protein
MTFAHLPASAVLFLDANTLVYHFPLAKEPSEELSMTKIFHGRVHGRTIELAEDPGLAEGQEVEGAVRTVSLAGPRQRGEGFLRTEGALADDPHWDAIMEEIHRERKTDTRREILE